MEGKTGGKNMNEKMKKKLVSIYHKNRVLGYLLVVIAAFVIVVKRRRAQTKSSYTIGSRRVAVIMICIIVTNMFFSPTVITLNKAYGATSGVALGWNELEFDFGILNTILDENGNMYLYDVTNQVLKKYDKDGNKYNENWTEPAVGNYSNKIGLCFTSNGDVVSSKDNEILFLDKITGAVKNKVDVGGIVTGCVCDEDGNVYVAAYIDPYGCIIKYSANGDEQWQANLMEGLIRGICLDDEGNIYSTSESKKCIIKVKASGVNDQDFGEGGILSLDGKVTTSGNTISGFLGDAAFFNGSLYQCCYGDKMVVKISENGKVLDEVASGVGPRNFLKFNNDYIIINRDGDTAKIERISTPSIDVEKENFVFSLEPSNLEEGSTETVQLSIRSDSTKNYNVKAKLYDKFTGAYVSDITSSKATLLNGNATLTLTPSASGWRKGVYQIQLEFSDTLGSMTLVDTINVNIVMGVGYYQVEYILENMRIEPKVEYIERVDGQDSYELTFLTIPDEHYVFSNILAKTIGEAPVPPLKAVISGNQITISNIQSDIQVHLIAKEEKEDTAAPSIIGLEDNGVYCEKQTVTVQDENLSKVIVNEQEVTLNENNQYELFPAQGIQTITAIDTSGNTTVIHFTINDGHTFGEWEETEKASCTQAGEKKHSCEICGHEEKEEIDALGHDWEEEYTIDKRPTLQEPGLKSIHCQRCDAKKDEKEIYAGEISLVVISEEGAPKVDVITTKEELSSFLFSQEEWERILFGEDGVITLRVKDGSKTVSESDKELVQQKLGENILGQYLDITLSKKVGNDSEKTILNTDETIKLTLQELNKPADTQEQKIGDTFIISVLGEESSILSDLDKQDKTITIETNEFRTYAIIYEKLGKQEETTTKNEETTTKEEITTTKNIETTKEEENTTVEEETTTYKSEESTTKEPEIDKKEPDTGELETTTKQTPPKKTEDKKDQAAPIVPQKKNPWASPPKAGDETPVLWLFIMEMLMGAGIYMLCCTRQKKKS